MFEVGDILGYNSFSGQYCLVKVLSKPEYSDALGCYFCEAIHVDGIYKDVIAYEFQLRGNVTLLSRGIIKKFNKPFKFS